MYALRAVCEQLSLYLLRFSQQLIAVKRIIHAIHAPDYL
jgi:hypothetical protein